MNAASPTPAFLNDMAEFYLDVDTAVAAHRPVCINRGACCKFAEFGHKLYVTDVELSYFVAGQGEAARPVIDQAACPYQIGGLCTARDHRPLGCRVFFCDPAAQDWQGPEYERFLTRLKAISANHGVAYRYREWLSALQDSGQTAQSIHPDLPQDVDRIALPVIK